jgi:hypothetical protein
VNAANCVGRWLDDDRHMKSVGVNKAVAIARDRHVAAPKYEIAARKLGEIDWRSERALLHVAVARASNAAGRKRELDQAGAVNPKHGLAAP